jgi:hypothetical protein
LDPIRTVNSNFTYLGPAPDIGDLPVRRGDGSVRSVWRLTDSERAMIANGAQIELAIYQEPMPPVALALTNEEPADDPDDLTCSNCGSIWRRDRGLRECGHCGVQLESAE